MLHTAGVGFGKRLVRTEQEQQFGDHAVAFIDPGRFFLSRFRQGKIAPRIAI